jgi:hypothetical protein
VHVWNRFVLKTQVGAAEMTDTAVRGEEFKGKYARPPYLPFVYTTSYHLHNRHHIYFLCFVCLLASFFSRPYFSIKLLLLLLLLCFFMGVETDGDVRQPCVSSHDYDVLQTKWFQILAR